MLASKLYSGNFKAKEGQAMLLLLLLFFYCHYLGFLSSVVLAINIIISLLPHLPRNLRNT